MGRGDSESPRRAPGDCTPLFKVATARRAPIVSWGFSQRAGLILLARVERRFTDKRQDEFFTR